ncbi:unnamed protein product [Prorocentrum cordatum]|uniref:WWE domain-containing protein n=1 Tax=Prorocentrum cordatum TaxID=2364126 RepID=A0ABN9TR15_9DINO|nr:unnamed protein product [Polarella glacialis]
MLYVAAEGGHTDTVELLLSVGAQVGSGARGDGATPLFAAAGYGHAEIAWRLLKAGCDANEAPAPAGPGEARADNGVPPLYLAVQEGHTEAAHGSLGGRWLAMATKHAATDDDAFDGALASLTAVRRDEVARARDAQARLGHAQEWPLAGATSAASPHGASPRPGIGTRASLVEPDGRVRLVAGPWVGLARPAPVEQRLRPALWRVKRTRGGRSAMAVFLRCLVCICGGCGAFALDGFSGGTANSMSFAPECPELSSPAELFEADGGADKQGSGEVSILGAFEGAAFGAAPPAGCRTAPQRSAGHAACLQGRSVEELRAWGEDAAAELASLGLSEPDGCGPVAEEQPAVRREVTADPSVLVGALETVPLQPPADGAATPSRAGPAGGAERAPSEKRGSGEAVVPGEAWPPAEEDSVVDVAGSVWQWEHRTGFRSYAAAESERIEEAWQSGESKVRLKAGKTGKIPMEIFFADMVQLDPTSGSQRNVRRVGHDSRFSRLERNLRQVWKAIHTGQLRWESSKQYRKRQATQRNQEKLSVIDASSMIVNKSQMFSRSHIDTGPATKRAHIGVWCGKLVQALWWNILTWLVTALNVFWIYWMAEHHEWTLVFWRPAEVIFIDFCFLLFFATELVIRVLSYRDATTALQSHFFLRDALVVALTLVEVVFFPMVSFASDAHELDPGSAWFTFALLVRLSRLVRVERLFRIFPQAATISRAIASGLESAAIILLMMIGFLFGFAVMLKTGVADRVVKEKYFSTMSRTLETLIVQGLFFDGILDYLQDCRDEFVGYFGMLFFVCVGQYIFLNMLILERGGGRHERTGRQAGHCVPRE